MTARLTGTSLPPWTMAIAAMLSIQLANALDCSCSSLDGGMMAGYGQTLGNSVFFEHGQHATSITGAMDC